MLTVFFLSRTKFLISSNLDLNQNGEKTTLFLKPLPHSYYFLAYSTATAADLVLSDATVLSYIFFSNFLPFFPTFFSYYGSIENKA